MVDRRFLSGILGLLLLSGCLGSVVKTVVTAPIKAAGAVVDATTTSRAEADRNRGREIREAEERDAKERKRQEKEARKQARREGLSFSESRDPVDGTPYRGVCSPERELRSPCVARDAGRFPGRT